METEPAAVWLDPTVLIPWARNPRKITADAVSQVADSIRRLGFGAPIVAQAGSLRIIAGHTRCRGAIEAGLNQVPVRLMAIDDRQAEALALADNRLSELVEWDQEGLDALLTELDGAGWDRTLLGFEALEALAAEAPEPEPVHDGPAASVTGDVYRLGPHVLACGDSSAAEPWAALDSIRGPAAYDLVWTDPPYGVEFLGVLAKVRGDRYVPIENDALKAEDLAAFLELALRPAYDRTAPGGAWYVASPARGELHRVFSQVLATMPTVERHGLIWEKDTFVFGRSDRHYQHEPIFYGWKDGAPHRWTGGRKRTSILRFDRPRSSADHPTMKPVELIEECLSCHRDQGVTSRRGTAEQWEDVSGPAIGGELVLDPFGGSGSTLIAAARLRMVAHTIELDPHYCDVIRRRWGSYAVKAGLEPGDSL